MKRAIVFAVILMFAPLCLATTIHVPADQPTIQAGIDAAVDGDTVLVADGHYYERINYFGKNIVVGSYFLIDKDTMHIANTVIDGDTTVLGASDSGSVVSFVNGEDSTTVLAGVTIINGDGLKNSYYGYGYGGGIICNGASPRIEHCSISGCSANGSFSYGGAACLLGGQASFSDCSFVSNRAEYGGAIYLEGASPEIRDCVFMTNSGRVGGALCSMDLAIAVDGCRFIENRAEQLGGAICGSNVDITNSCFLRNQASEKGGAIHVVNSAIITGCRFEGNHTKKTGSGSNMGGAVNCVSAYSLRIANCVFSANFSECGGAVAGKLRVLSNTAIIGCTFTKNQANWGGAAHLSVNMWSSGFLLETCTFDENTAFKEGGALSTGGKLPTIRSCSFVRNSAPSASWLTIYPRNQEIVRAAFEDCLVAFNRGGSIVAPADSGWFLPTLTCCNIYGNEGGDWISYIASLADSNGNFSADPLFCDTTSGDFHLQGNSPCAPSNNSCGVLIGALPVACGWGCGDIDGSGGVNVTDAVRLIYYLFANGSEPLDLSGGDVNQDGRLNVADVVYLINYIFVGGPAPCAVM